MSAHSTNGGVGPSGRIRPQSAIPHGRPATHPMQDPRRQPLQLVDSSQTLYSSSLEPEGEEQDEHPQWRKPRPLQETTLI